MVATHLRFTNANSNSNVRILVLGKLGTSSMVQDQADMVVSKYGGHKLAPDLLPIEPSVKSNG